MDWVKYKKDMTNILNHMVDHYGLRDKEPEAEAAAAPEAAPSAEAGPITYLPNIETGETSAAYTLRARKVNKGMLSAADTLL